MERFIPKLKSDREFADKIVRKYHFGAEYRDKIMVLSSAAMPLITAAAYYVWKCHDDDAGAYREIQYDEYAVCLVTLGTGFDRMVDLYSENNCLMEAYMLDCIGLEFMTQSYEQLVKHIQIKYKKWGTRFDFLGDDYPVNMMSDLMKDFPETGVTVNAEMMLTPLKSVLFLLPVSDQEQKTGACNVCTNCGNVSCMFREDPENNRKRDADIQKIINGLRSIKDQSGISKNMGTAGGSYGISQVFKMPGDNR